MRWSTSITGPPARPPQCGATAVEPNLKRPLLGRPVTDMKRVSGVHGKGDVVFEHPRQLASVADHEFGKLVSVIGVDVRVGENLGIAAIERPSLNLERGGRFRHGGYRLKRNTPDGKVRYGEHHQCQPAAPPRQVRFDSHHTSPWRWCDTQIASGGPLVWQHHCRDKDSSRKDGRFSECYPTGPLILQTWLNLPRNRPTKSLVRHS